MAFSIDVLLVAIRLMMWVNTQNYQKSKIQSPAGVVAPARVILLCCSF